MLAPDLVIYINLNRRTDRRSQIEAELKRLGIPESKILRWTATPCRPGSLGCSRSHVGVLKHIQTLPDDVQTVLILEDDFEFIADVELVNQSIAKFLAYPRESWDLVLLGYHMASRENYDDLVSLSLTAYMACAYLVNRAAVPKIQENFEEGCEQLARTGNAKFLLDEYWNHFMKNRRCFYFNTPLGGQRRSYSDIDCATVQRPSKIC